MNDPIKGECVEIGDIENGAGFVTTGLLIEIPRELLAEMKANPLYRTVEVRIVEEATV